MVISGCASSFLVTACGKSVAVDGERAAGRHLVRVAGAHDQRTGQPHFGVQQADGIVFGIVGTEGIGADQLGQPIGLVRIGAANGPHFMQHDRHAGLRRLPCRFGPGEAAADDVDGIFAHERRNNRLQRRLQLPGLGDETDAREACPKTTTPAGGGGPAGVVLVVDPREEVKIDRIRHCRGGGRL